MYSTTTSASTDKEKEEEKEAAAALRGNLDMAQVMTVGVIGTILTGAVMIYVTSGLLLCQPKVEMSPFQFFVT